VVVIILGVSGAGKTTVGKLLAQELRWAFYEADDYHPRANIDKMRSGRPLTDEDRKPWLKSLRELIEKCLKLNQNAVLACSALKRKYRRYLRVGPEVQFVFLHGDRDRIAWQLKQRRGHFMKPELLDSQFADLEEPAPEEHVITVDLGPEPKELVEQIKSKML
jgi:gluconokinase